jgi:hypothetical protein
MYHQQPEEFTKQQLQKRQQATAQLMSQQSTSSKSPVAVASIQPPGTRQSKSTCYFLTFELGLTGLT